MSLAFGQMAADVDSVGGEALTEAVNFGDCSARVGLLLICDDLGCHDSTSVVAVMWWWFHYRDGANEGAASTRSDPSGTPASRNPASPR